MCLDLLFRGVLEGSFYMSFSGAWFSGRNFVLPILGCLGTALLKTPQFIFSDKPGSLAIFLLANGPLEAPC